MTDKAQRMEQPTVNDGERLILKMDGCTSMAAKLVLLRQFVQTTKHREYDYGAQVTQDAGKARSPVVGCAVDSAGLLLYAHVYEARWAGLKTAEICPRWKELPQVERDRWQLLAQEIGDFTNGNRKAGDD